MFCRELDVRLAKVFEFLLARADVGERERTHTDFALDVVDALLVVHDAATQERNLHPPLVERSVVLQLGLSKQKRLARIPLIFVCHGRLLAAPMPKHSVHLNVFGRTGHQIGKRVAHAASGCAFCASSMTTFAALVFDSISWLQPAII